MPDADFFFDFISPYSYLAQTQLTELAARTGAQFKLWPMHLLNLMNIVGNTPTTVHFLEAELKERKDAPHE
jgi:2-hydroxychromene-2-carboxylate isomerase